jgi:phospholipid-transporting ATPase
VYLGFSYEASTNNILLFIIKFGTWFLSMMNLVPISLMVTLELVKFIQASFIGCDYMMYDEEKDMFAKV